MKTTKILLWDEIGHEGGFICLPSHPEAKEMEVFQFQPKEAQRETHFRDADGGDHSRSFYISLPNIA
jgi:hypothetical protein